MITNIRFIGGRRLWTLPEPRMGMLMQTNSDLRNPSEVVDGP
ncbi:hypothetical protein N9C98_00365 [Synechococcus sp. AH-224-G16]|nr:hypothetical protein [Synechococcus sp. AH-224-G16]